MTVCIHYPAFPINSHRERDWLHGQAAAAVEQYARGILQHFPYVLNRGDSQRVVIDTRVRRALGATLPKPYPVDVRERMIEAVAAGASQDEAAELRRISRYLVVIWVRHWKAAGTVASPSGEGVPPREDHVAFLLGMVTRQTDLTVEEIVAAMTKVGISTSCTTVRRFCERHGISLPTKHLHAQQRRRAAVARLRGCRDRHLIGRAPHGHGMTTPFVTDLRRRKAPAPFVLDGAMNGRMFPAYAKQRRAPRQGSNVETSPSWTICLCLKLLAFARRLKREVRCPFVCRPIDLNSSK
jgi:transposase